MPRAAVRIAAMLLAVVASAIACGAASSRPSQTTSAPPASTKYVSKRYGYEIVLRGRYYILPAQRQWDGRFPFGATGQVDLIGGYTQDHRFAIAAKPVRSGMSLSRWGAFVVRVQRRFCHGLRNSRASSLGGEPAREFVNSCPPVGSSPGFEVITLAALHKGRGYLLNYLSAPGYSAASDRRIYEAGRRAFKFT
jgi:hypothetical protein